MAIIGSGYFYSVKHMNGPLFEDAYELMTYDWNTRVYDLDDDWDLEFLAEACAEDYTHNHDGWEHKSWMEGYEELVFYIWKDKDTKIPVRLTAEPTVKYHAELD